MREGETIKNVNYISFFKGILNMYKIKIYLKTKSRVKVYF